MVIFGRVSFHNDQEQIGGWGKTVGCTVIAIVLDFGFNASTGEHNQQPIPLIFWTERIKDFEMLSVRLNLILTSFMRFGRSDKMSHAATARATG